MLFKEQKLPLAAVNAALLCCTYLHALPVMSALWFYKWNVVIFYCAFFSSQRNIFPVRNSGTGLSLYSSHFKTLPPKCSFSFSRILPASETTFLWKQRDGSVIKRGAWLKQELSQLQKTAGLPPLTITAYCVVSYRNIAGRLRMADVLKLSLTQEISKS